MGSDGIGPQGLSSSRLKAPSVHTHAQPLKRRGLVGVCFAEPASARRIHPPAFGRPPSPRGDAFPAKSGRGSRQGGVSWWKRPAGPDLLKAQGFVRAYVHYPPRRRRRIIFPDN